MIKFIHLIFMLLSLTFVISPSVADNGVRIGGGPKDGEYIHIAKSLCDALGTLFSCNSLETKGTIANKEHLEKGEVEFAIAKSNIADGWMKDQKFAARHTIIRRIGDESLFVFGKKETLNAIGSWLGVRENASLISIGLPGEKSGDTALFNFLKAAEGSPLVNIDIKMYPGRPELVKAVTDGKVQLGFIGQIPNPDNPLFKAINDAGLMIMGVVDPDMISFGDTFRIKPVTVKNAKWFGFSGSAQQIETANVPAAILAVKPEAMEGRSAKVQEAAIKKIQGAAEADLLPKQGWMQQLANTASLKAGPSLEKVMTSMKSAADGAKERLNQIRATGLKAVTQ
ncbi:conserved exported hypothetical protein [Gammaproteobacteria bacterium]